MVVDIYSDWRGPCRAMTNFLKKIKLEVNDDLLHYAMAKSGKILHFFLNCMFFKIDIFTSFFLFWNLDTIPQLECFRGQCKPTWLFMAGGILKDNINTFF